MMKSLRFRQNIFTAQQMGDMSLLHGEITKLSPVELNVCEATNSEQQQGTTTTTTTILWAF